VRNVRSGDDRCTARLTVNDYIRPVADILIREQFVVLGPSSVGYIVCPRRTVARVLHKTSVASVISPLVAPHKCFFGYPHIHRQDHLRTVARVVQKSSIGSVILLTLVPGGVVLRRFRTRMSSAGLRHNSLRRLRNLRRAERRVAAAESKVPGTVPVTWESVSGNRCFAGCPAQPGCLSWKRGIGSRASQARLRGTIRAPAQLVRAWLRLRLW
jgi:hypothetical protein